MRFSDRIDAGQQLAKRLQHLSVVEPVVLALPRGGIPVAAEIARVLNAPMDVLVVRKLGVPFQPELAMGAVGEDGVVVWNDEVRRAARISEDDVLAVVARERDELQRRARSLRGRPPVDVAGRTVVVVDDGIATGSTAVVACRMLRTRGAARVVVAVPVAPAGTVAKLAGEADDVVTVVAPPHFASVGEWYDDFTQVTDEQAARFLGAPPAVTTSSPPDVGAEVDVAVAGVHLRGLLAVPDRARGVVLFAHGTGSNRTSPRNRAVAAALAEQGFATLLFDLLTPAEQDAAGAEALDVDVPVAGRRLAEAVEWVRRRPAVVTLPVGLFGASTGAAVALWAAAEPSSPVGAVVSRGGRPDLAAARLADVRAPTLLIVGGRDGYVEDANRRALPLLTCPAELAVVAGAGHLFDQPGALATVTSMASAWFREHLLAPALSPAT